jgi:thioredoxin-dependent peroxiredoxin
LRDDYAKFTELNAEVLAIAPETPASADKYLKANPMPYPLLVDEDHAVFDSYDVVSKLASLGQRPALFVVDAQGIVRFNEVGTQQWQIPPNDQVLELLRTSV